MSNYYDLIKKGLSGAVNVAAGAVSKAAEVAKDLAEDLTSFRALKDYKLAGHVATAGPGATWKIYNAISKKPGAVFPEAAVWILNKKQLVDEASRGGRARGFDQFFEQQRRGCAQLLRIKHPGVVKVLEPLEETSGQMVMVTEPVFGSIHNVQTHFRDVPNSGAERSAAQLSQLELKYGMMHVAETVQFLHQEAKLVHCNLNPGSLIITRDGSWKLAGFAFVGSCDFGGAAGQLTSFEYLSSQPVPWEEYVVPPLSYTAPELLAGSMTASEQRLSPASDVFSLAAITYELVKGKPLLPVGSSTGEYRSRVGMLSSADLSGVPGTLQSTLVPMMATAAAARPNAAAFASCQWFQEDMLLRALRFLDSILQRESSQKVAFLKDLSTFWQQFDERLLLHKILPPIVQEMRNEMVSLAALPMVLAIMSKMTPEQFQDSGILPVIKPVFDSADGELLLALVRHLNVFHRLMTGNAVATTLLPLMLRACDSSSTRTQEEVLKGLSKSALDLPYQVLRDALMPKVIAMCLRTTSLVVRCAALGLMAQAVTRLDKEAAMAMLDVSGKVLAVDKSAGTAMAVLSLSDAVSKHYGPEVTAQSIMPMLCPVLMAPGVSGPQLSAYLAALRGMLDQIQAKRSGDLASNGGAAIGTPGVAPSTPIGAASGGQSPLAATGGGSMAAWSAAGAAAPPGESATTTINSTSTSTSWQAAAGFGASHPVIASTNSSSNAVPTWSQGAGNAGSGGGWGAPSSSSATAATPAAAGASWMASAAPAAPSAAGKAGWGSSGASWPAAPSGVGSAAPSGVKPGLPAPDIFSDDPLGGLGSLGSSLPQPAPVPQGRLSAAGGGAGGQDDLFGGLATRPTGTTLGGPPGGGSSSATTSFALRPPPSAGTLGMGLGGGGGGSSQDPFAALATLAPAGGSMAAPRATPATASSGFDPFATASATHSQPADPFAAWPGSSSAAAAAAADPFAALASGTKPMGMAQQRAPLPPPQQQQQQQQQQQWGGAGGGSLI